MNQTSKILLSAGVLAGIALLARKAQKAANAENNIFVDIVPSDVYLSKGTFYIQLNVSIENKAGIDLSLNNLWTRLQYQDKSGKFIDIGRGQADISSIQLIAYKTTTFILPLKVSGFGSLQAILGGAQAIRAITSFTSLGMPIEYPSGVDLNAIKEKIRKAIGLSGSQNYLTETNPGFYEMI